MNFDWVATYTMARKVLGWSDSEFWSSTPRKFNAVFWQTIELEKPPEAKPKKGSDAINDILKTFGGM